VLFRSRKVTESYVWQRPEFGPFDLVDTEQHNVLEVSNVSLERRCCRLHVSSAGEGDTSANTAIIYSSPTVSQIAIEAQAVLPG
jgi:hypothetical protein